MQSGSGGTGEYFCTLGWASGLSPLSLLVQGTSGGGLHCRYRFKAGSRRPGPSPLVFGVVIGRSSRCPSGGVGASTRCTLQRTRIPLVASEVGLGCAAAGVPEYTRRGFRAHGPPERRPVKPADGLGLPARLELHVPRKTRNDRALERVEVERPLLQEAQNAEQVGERHLGDPMAPPVAIPPELVLRQQAEAPVGLGPGASA
jgi:hypothetical protein